MGWKVPVGDGLRTALPSMRLPGLGIIEQGNGAFEEPYDDDLDLTLDLVS